MGGGVLIRSESPQKPYKAALTVPLFTVVMPVHNRATLVGASISTVMAQQFEDWELIVVNNGSSDNTAEAVAAAAKGDQRVRLIELTEANRSAARNAAIAEARGTWICFLDSDDFYEPNHLSTIAEAIAAMPKVSAFATRINRSAARRADQRWVSQKKLWTLADVLADNPLSVMQMAYRLGSHVRLRFHSELVMAEDWLFVRHLLSETNVTQLVECTVRVGEHGGRSVNTTALGQMAEAGIKATAMFCELPMLMPNHRALATAHAHLLAANLYADEGQLSTARKHLNLAQLGVRSLWWRSFKTAVKLSFRAVQLWVVGKGR